MVDVPWPTNQGAPSAMHNKILGETSFFLGGDRTELTETSIKVDRLIDRSLADIHYRRPQRRDQIRRPAHPRQSVRRQGLRLDQSARHRRQQRRRRQIRLFQQYVSAPFRLNPAPSLSCRRSNDVLGNGIFSFRSKTILPVSTRFRCFSLHPVDESTAFPSAFT